jgi:hypothetical protein
MSERPVRIRYKGELQKVVAAWKGMRYEFAKGEIREVSRDTAQALLSQSDKYEEVIENGTRT